MKQQRVTLDVPFEHGTQLPPILWDWDLMLGVKGVVVVGADPITEHVERNQIGEAVATHQSDPE